MLLDLTTLSPLDRELEAAVRRRIAESSFGTWMGLAVTALYDGGAEFRLDVQPHHLNPGGLVHGGIVATILDASIGLALRTKIGLRAHHVTLQLNLNYISPAKGGTIFGRGRAIHSGRRTGVGEAQLLTPDDRLLAVATGTFLITAE